MASEDDVRGTKAARSECGKRGIDMTYADVRVMHGICYIRGTVGKIRGSTAGGELRSEIEKVVKSLKAKPEIRDVIVDLIYRT